MHFQKGNHSEALELIDNLQGEDLLEGLIFKSRIYQQLGEFDNGLSIGNLVVEKARSTENRIIELGALSIVGYNYYRLGQFEDGKRIFREGEAILESLDFQEKAGGQEWIGLFLHTRGTTCIFNWELDKAIIYLKQCLDIRKGLGNNRDISSTLNNIGEVYRMKGDYSQALDYYQQSLTIDQEFESLYGVAISLGNIGMINYNMGEYEEALHHYQQSVEMLKVIDNKYFVATYLFNLIRIALELKMQDYALQCLNELSQLSHQSPNPRIQYRTELGEALILVYNPRLKEKMKAQEKLEALSEKKDIELELKVVAQTHLCELLLIELRLFENEDVFNEVITIVTELNNIGNSQKVFTLVVDSMLLLAKLYLLKGEIELVDDILSKAQLYASEKGLSRHSKRVNQERVKFEKEINIWKNINNELNSMDEMISRVEVDDYLEAIRHIVDL